MFRTPKRSRPTAEHYVDHGWDALEDDDPDGAEAEARAALKIAPDDGEALEVLGAALVDLERYEEALPVLAAALEKFEDDPSILLDLAIAHVGCYHLKDALRVLRSLAVRDPKNPDIRWWLGVTHEFLGDEKSARSAYAKAADLDGDCFSIPPRVPREEFEALVQEAVQELPDELKQHLDGEVMLSVTDVPSRSIVTSEEPAVSPLVLGLFVGPAVSERSVFETPSLSPMILVFQRNIERVARTHDEFVEELRITILHELGHYLGLDEDDLARRGLE